MDRPSTIMLCRVVPGIGFNVIRVFSASATNSGILQRFQESYFHRAHALPRHAWRYRITMRVATRARVEFL
jgi:hypothetical protein